MRSTGLPHREGRLDSATGGDILSDPAPTKSILVGPALRTQVGIMAKLPGPGHVVGVILGGLGEGRTHPMRPQASAPPDVVIPHEHGKQGRMAMERSLLHSRLGRSAHLCFAGGCSLRRL